MSGENVSARIPEWSHAADRRFNVSYDAIDRGVVIGVGGNATVYATTGPEGTPLALKEPHIDPPVPDAIRTRFEQEIDAWRRVDDHPNVVTLHAAGTDPHPWLALERVAGGTLNSYDPASAEALWIGYRLAAALAHAHEAGVAHLDVTPGNVLLRETDGGIWPVPALTDWGVGTLLKEQAVNVEGLSPQYAAPEQFAPDEFGAPDDRTDVYQLGTVLYELLTGAPPFTGLPATLKQAIVGESPDPATGLTPALSAAVDPVLDRALIKDPRDRYESAGAFAAALAEIFTAETGYELDAPTGAAADIGTAGTEVTPTDGRLESTGTYDRAIALDEQGFIQLTDQYFARREPAPLLDAWRRGLNLVDVQAGRAVARDPPRAAGQDDGAVADVKATSMADALGQTLREGTDSAVLGPPGSGKSTVCKQVACAWVNREYGPVFYRESGGTTFDDPAAITRLLARIEDDDHALVVVEDAVRPDAQTVFELLQRVQATEDVSVLVDAREGEWRTAGSNADSLGSTPIAEGKQHLTAAFVPRPDRATHKRVIEQATAAVADASAIGADHLAAEVRRARPAESTNDSKPGELFYLIHRLTALGQDPLAEETTTLTDTVRAVREEVAAAGERALDVGLAVNLLNAAGLGVHPELVHAVTPEEPVAVDDAINVLDGRVVFPRDPDWSAGPEPYPAVHEAWSAEYLAAGLDVAGDQAARERFGRVLTRLLAVADDPCLHEHIAGRLHGQAPYLDRVAADPADWVEDTLDQLLEFGEQQPRLGPLFGTTETAAYDLPAVCPDAIQREMLKRRGDIQRKRGSYQAARSEYERFLERARASGDRQGEAASLGTLGKVAYKQSEYATAREYLQASLAITQEIGDRQGHAYSLHNLGEVARHRGEYATAREYYEQSLSIRRELDDRQGEARSLNNHGIVVARQGEYDPAREYFEESLAISQEVGDRQGQAYSLINLGEVTRHRGEPATAREYFEESLAINRELGDRRGEAISMNNLGEVAQHRGEYTTAREYLKESLSIRRELDDRRGEAISLNNLGEVAQHRGEYTTAREYFEQSLAINREHGDRQGEADSLNNLGSMACEQGDFDAAREYHETAVDIYSDLGAVRTELEAIEARARVAVETDDREAAIEWCDRGLARIDETYFDGFDDQRTTFKGLHPEK